MWILERLGELTDADLLSRLKDSDRAVRVHAENIVAEREKPSIDLLNHATEGLKDQDPFVRRAAADAPGRHPRAENVRALLDARHAATAEDEALVHVIRMALRDQFLTTAKLTDTPAEPYTERDMRALADIALGVHSVESATFLLGFLKASTPKSSQFIEDLHHIARYGDRATDPMLLRLATAHRPDDLLLQADLVKAVHRGLQERGAPLVGPTLEWASGVAGKLLKSERPPSLAQGIELTETLRLRDNRDAVAAIIRMTDRPEAVRIAAVNAVATLDPATAAEPLGTVLTDQAAPASLREAAAIALGKTNQDTSRAKLVEALPIAHDRLQAVIAAALASNRPGAEALLNAVTAGKASARLLQERAVRIWLDQSGLPDLPKRIEALTAGLPAADAKIVDVIKKKREALAKAQTDPSRGAAVFKTQCAICHQIGGQGAKVGPQLDGIGVRGGDRLLEDVLDPNRNVDQAFRLTTLALKDGRVLSGLLLREEGDVLILADAQGKEQRITKETVEERKVAPLSPMPADFAEKVKEGEFLDLIAYLLTVKGR